MDVKFIRVTGGRGIAGRRNSTCKGPTCGVFRDGAELASASVQGMGWEVIGDEAGRRDTVGKCHKYHAGELGFDPRRRGRALGQETGMIRPVDFREDSDSRHGLEG